MKRHITSWILLAILLAFPIGADVLYSGFYISLLNPGLYFCHRSGRI